MLHWRVDRDRRSVAAVGVIEVGAPERIAGVTLELQGFDRKGRLVSRRRAWTYPRSFTGVEPWPFSASLRPTGSEERFVVTVVDVTWKMQQPSGR